MTSITLKDVDTDSNKVNSGIAIDMQSESLDMSVNIFSNISQQPAKSINQSHQNLLAFGDYVGFQNPALSLKGVIDLKKFTADTGGGTAPSNTISLYLLIQMYKSGHIFELEDYYSSGTNFIYRTHTLTGTFPNETKTKMKVIITGFSLNHSSSETEGEKLSYSLELSEVRNS